MAETLTAHYGWTKPDPGFSANTWGVTSNQTVDKIDAQMFLIAQTGVPVGAMLMWGTATPPTNWLLCNGQALSTVGTYAALFAVLGYTHGGSGGTFNLPNLQQKFPLGAGPNPVGQVAGSFSVSIATGNLPAHAHQIIDVAHSHSVNQWAHAHGIATGGHSHTISTGGHTHANALVTSGVTGGVPAGVGIVGNVANLTAGDLGGSTNFVGNLGGNTDTQVSAVSLNASGTGLSTTQNTGSGTPLSVVPPYIAMYFIVKYA